MQKLIEEIKEAGFDCAVAIATNAEVKAGAACGQLSLFDTNSKEICEK